MERGRVLYEFNKIIRLILYKYIIFSLFVCFLVLWEYCASKTKKGKVTIPWHGGGKPLSKKTMNSILK